MSQARRLIDGYKTRVGLPWETHLAPPQRVWFVVHDKAHERKIRSLLDEFPIATSQAGKHWVLLDLTNAFPEWMAHLEYRESYFQNPEFLNEGALQEFRDHLIGELRRRIRAVSSPENTVFALIGVASLFGFLRVSELISRMVEMIEGRLVVFFPGRYENGNYRLLDAHDGWNYLAVPIIDLEGDK